jgi:hypothetical protein
VRDWLKTYGWRFAIALILAAIAMAYIVHAERHARGLDYGVSGSVAAQTLAV